MSLSQVINKTIFKYGLAASLFAFSVGVAPSCNTAMSSANKQQLEKIREMHLPLFSDEELLTNTYTGTRITQGVKVHVKPAFYSGPMPLEFKSISTPGKYTSGFSRTLVHNFKDYDNYFIYDRNIVSGVITVNHSNERLAEARVKYIFNNDKVHLMMEEFHYAADGSLGFKCISSINNNTGEKETEVETMGKKEKEYFFIMPMGIHK